MKTIKTVEELELLVANHKAQGYYVRLNYGLITGLTAGYGEDGRPQIKRSGVKEIYFKRNDFYNSQSPLKSTTSIMAFHSRD
jgi:hypothetical protein